MAANDEPGVGDQIKSGDNNENNFRKCSQCKRPVKEKVQCKKCKLIFHPSCLIAANKSKNNVCMHEQDEDQNIIERLVSEIKLLKKIITEQEEKFNLLKENKILLEDNNRLLKEQNEFLISQGNKKTFSEVIKETSKNQTTENRTKKVNIQETREVNLQEKNQPGHSKLKPPTTVKSKNLLKSPIQDAFEIPETPEQKEKEEREQWQVQTRRKINKENIRKPLFYGASEEDSVKGLPRFSWYFVSRLSPEMTEEQIKSTMLKKCHNSDIIVEKQKLYYDYQSAFKIGIPVELKEQANNAQFWPKDSRINKYDFFLERKKKQQIK